MEEIKFKIVQNKIIESTMDSMSCQLTSIDKLSIAQLIIKSGIADIQKSLNILRETKRQIEGQLKLFRQNKKALKLAPLSKRKSNKK